MRPICAMVKPAVNHAAPSALIAMLPPVSWGTKAAGAGGATSKYVIVGGEGATGGMAGAGAAEGEGDGDGAGGGGAGAGAGPEAAVALARTARLPERTWTPS